MPALKPLRFRSTATPPSRIAASKSEADSGSAPEAASAPMRTALTSLPAARATARASHAIRRRLSARAASTTNSAGKIPLPRADFSPMANRRWVLAMSVVRSGEA